MRQEDSTDNVNKTDNLGLTPTAMAEGSGFDSQG